MSEFIKYARHEPTTDSTTLSLWPHSKKQDVQIYHDSNCKQPYARFMWWSSSKPTKRNKSVMINCFRWTLKWCQP